MILKPASSQSDSDDDARARGIVYDKELRDENIGQANAEAVSSSI